jgi:hypothetical protein
MNLLHRSAVTFGVCCCFALASTSTTRAAAPAATPAKPTKPAAPPPAKPGPSPVAPAVAALVKEYQTSLKEKKGEGLREKCDYFTSAEKPEGVTPEVILAALEKPIPGAGDARAEAYVKWQLLSGVAGQFADELKPRAIKAYRSAPQPSDHPARNHKALDQKLYRIGLFNADREVDINKELSEAIAQYRLYVDPILEYRDEFYKRLPGGYDTLVAGVQDTFDRVSHGAPATEFWKTVGGQIRAWALTASDAGKLHEMAGAVIKLNEYVKDERNKPYYRVIFSQDPKNGGLKWQPQSTIEQEGRYVGELGDWLDERAKNPSESGGALQFKEKEGDDMKKTKKK